MKILAFTSIRSDYDLMSPLYSLLNSDPEINFKIIVSGAHLSPSHGYSVREVEADGLPVLSRIETLLDGDSRVSRVKSASILLQTCIETVNNFDPDLMIYAGDREDVIMYAVIGGYLGIPTAHFYSGDHVSDGYIDNPVRHATSKLSTVHFVSLDEHKKRLIKMGEMPERIFPIGNMSLDKFKRVNYIPIEELRKKYSIPEKNKDLALLIFHPHSEEYDVSGSIFKNIVENLLSKNIFSFVSYPNTDLGNSILISAINSYADNKKIVIYKNLDRITFLSLYKNAAFIIGNSSSGICEAASLGVPAINVGIRQTGRFSGGNVIFCKTDSRSISDAIDLAMSSSFREKQCTGYNPYGDGESAAKAYALIKEIDFKKLLLKREDPLEVGAGE